MSGWTPWRRDRTRELPGTLCDETPQALHADGPTWPQKAPQYLAPAPPPRTEPGKLPPPPAPEIGRWQPRTDDTVKPARPANPIPTHPTPEVLRLRQQLREVTADRDTLDAANGRLIARARLYRSMLAELGVSPITIAELERADGVWHDHGNDLVTPWPARE